MDDEGEWSATTLFSPSKARAHQAQARDWAVVDAWLSKRYASKRLPAFEKNEETLDALLDLATLNDTADERRGYTDRIDKAALSSFTKRATSTDRIYHLLSRGSKNAAALNVLAESSVTLDCASPDIIALAGSITELMSISFALEEQLHRVQSQLVLIKADQVHLAKQLEELQSNDFRPPSDLAEQTIYWIRNTKHMRAKLAEYDERLSALDTTGPYSALIDAVSQYGEELNTTTAQLKSLELQIQSFQSLPSDMKAARSKVDGARRELLACVKERDRLFELLSDTG